ncbi:tetraacyldisaccharide 4'-kinase [Candidatus Parabeggiatoa sp. HSG14]|uniref:tetraacyldisaccharide 4'-kinase n=1 Tax=Candidatus Parabeggiatoa sp. HSG14 TaxID=3055593 RepID=UPI0025A78E20|nr:tetraacyldisaccharide 4'-kinase [Thiotrichales bacterium HSG14]
MTLNTLWYSQHPLRFALIPLSKLFCAIVKMRRFAYKHDLLTRNRISVPVIIVGNITVGGTGKTPLVIWLGQFLKKQGFKPGIVSRGYGGNAKKWPQSVLNNSDPRLVGDESVLIAKHSGCPVAVAPQRIEAAQSLLDKTGCNIIISDDGLQHYALHRDIEIVVVDGIRCYGNGHCLPAGPLRESVSRLEYIDFLVVKKFKKQLLQKMGGMTTVQEFQMQNHFKPLRHVIDDSIVQLSALHNHAVHAVAGIGHPTQFFNHLREQGFKVHCHEFPDHHYYKKFDIQFDDNLPVIMTEKDAVKCRDFAKIQHWYLPIEAHLPQKFCKLLLHKIKRIKDGKSVA